MTQSPRDAPHLQDGTDVEADPDDLDAKDTPATSDPESFNEDENLGGVGGSSPGGAG